LLRRRSGGETAGVPSARVNDIELAATSAYVPPDRLFSRRWLIMDVLSQIPVPKSVDPQPRYAWRRQRGVSAASDGFDVTPRLGELDVPTLVVHATKDHIVPFSLGQKMARRIRDARFVIVPGGHRALFTSHADRPLGEVKSFMADS
jgi:pimeloyl-ACP methyl ester carboxylesterase